MATKISTKHVETVTNDEVKRKNIPSVEQQSIATPEHIAPRQVRYPRNIDLDLQLVWHGKDEQDWSYLMVNAPPLYLLKDARATVDIHDFESSK